MPSQIVWRLRARIDCVNLTPRMCTPPAVVLQGLKLLAYSIREPSAVGRKRTGDYPLLTPVERSDAMHLQRIKRTYLMDIAHKIECAKPAVKGAWLPMRALLERMVRAYEDKLWLVLSMDACRRYSNITAYSLSFVDTPSALAPYHQGHFLLHHGGEGKYREAGLPAPLWWVGGMSARHLNLVVGQVDMRLRVQKSDGVHPALICTSICLSHVHA